MTNELTTLAVKSVFENVGTDIRNMGIQGEVLNAAVAELVKDYSQDQEWSLAVKAASVTDDKANYRVIWEAMKAARPLDSDKVMLIDHIIDMCQRRGDFLTVALNAADESELKEYAAKCNDRQDAIKILVHLKDGSALLEFAKKAEGKYFDTIVEEKRTKVSNGGTTYILRDSIDAYAKALELGEDAATKELERLADRMHEVHGFGHYYSFNSGSLFSSTRETDPAIGIYERIGTPECLRKAAAGREELGRKDLDRKSSKASSVKELSIAGKLYAQVGEADKTRTIVETLVDVGEMAAAVGVLGNLNGGASADDLAGLIQVSIKGSIPQVKEAITKYLDDHDTEIPFPTAFTFWHFSDSNDEWAHYRRDVDELAGRFDGHYMDESRERKSLAKYLYSSDKKDVIQNIHTLLKRHLIVGWMLSGIAHEHKYGPAYRDDRKYKHPSYAAWRSFSYAFEASGYNPFSGDIGLKGCPNIKELYDYLSGIGEEESKLSEKRDGWLHDTPESNRFLASKMSEMHERAKVVYDQIAEEIRQQVDLL